MQNEQPATETPTATEPEPVETPTTPSIVEKFNVSFFSCAKNVVFIRVDDLKEETEKERVLMAKEVEEMRSSLGLRQVIFYRLSFVSIDYLNSWPYSSRMCLVNVG